MSSRSPTTAQRNASRSPTTTTTNLHRAGKPAAASSKQAAALPSPTFKKIPFRTGGVPQCGHECCLSKSKGVRHSLFGSPRPADDKTRAGGPQWQGPSGVVTTFFKLSTNDDPDKIDITFLAGFDKFRVKNSSCSGTLSDSWPKDCGCGVWGALRESAEEFKIIFYDDKEFLQHVAFYWWEGNTLCFAVDMNTFPDQRADITYLQKAIRAALVDPSLPGCEKEINAIHEFTVPLMATETLKTKKIEQNGFGFGGFSGFGLMTFNSVLKTMQRVVMGSSSNRNGGGTPAAAAAAAASLAAAPAAAPIGAVSKAAAGAQQMVKKDADAAAQKKEEPPAGGDDIKK